MVRLNSPALKAPSGEARKMAQTSRIRCDRLLTVGALSVLPAWPPADALPLPLAWVSRSGWEPAWPRSCRSHELGRRRGRFLALAASNSKNPGVEGEGLSVPLTGGERDSRRSSSSSGRPWRAVVER
jgi:hypothetical protein